MRHAETRIGAAIAGGVLFVLPLVELAFGEPTAIGAHLVTALLGLGLIAASFGVRLS